VKFSNPILKMSGKICNFKSNFLLLYETRYSSWTTPTSSPKSINISFNLWYYKSVESVYIKILLLIGIFEYFRKSINFSKSERNYKGSLTENKKQVLEKNNNKLWRFNFNKSKKGKSYTFSARLGKKFLIYTKYILQGSFVRIFFPEDFLIKI
jgi:hypothetical protein